MFRQTKTAISQIGYSNRINNTALLRYNKIVLLPSLKTKSPLLISTKSRAHKDTINYWEEHASLKIFHRRDTKQDTE